MVVSEIGIPAGRELFGSLFTDPEIEMEIRIRNDINTTYAFPYGRYTDEKYVLEINNGKIKAFCSGEKSAFYAICDVTGRVKRNALRDGSFSCAPGFRTRGFIEGFYGNPWTFDERVSVIKTMAAHRMNAVYYAPKDDSYHRERWNELYPPESLKNIEMLCSLARFYYMDYFWCAAPGLSIRYSSDEDYDSLCKKYKQLYAVGVRNFGLLLDDISETLRYADDRVRYGEVVNAHIDLISRVFDFLFRLDPAVKLTVCPTVYHGAGDEYYISKLGRSIDPRILLFWTGRDICSREISASQAADFAASTLHKPLYWDNYPVNDEAMYHEMHLGPLIGRDPLLCYTAEGLIANCMEYAECSKIPLITIADYLWDPESYNPETAWNNAVYEIIGAENADSFICFAEHLRTSCLRSEGSSRLKKLFTDVENAYAENRINNAELMIAAYGSKMEQALAYLHRDLPICKELGPWTNKYALACDLILCILKYMGDRENDALAEKICSMMHKYLSDPTVCIEEMVLKEALMGRYRTV